MAGEPQPAELVFSAAFLMQARGVSKPDFKPFAVYSGTVELVGSKREPVFRCDPAAEIVYLAPDEREAEIVRKVGLDYDGAQFKEAPTGEAPAATLLLPEEPEGARFAEVGVELKVAGAVEAELLDNDRLDLELPPIVQRLVLEWPDSYSKRASDLLVLEAKAGKVVRSVTWSSGEVIGDMRRLVFERLPLEPVSLSARSGGSLLALWLEQDLTQAEREPEWRAWLEDVLGDIDSDEEPEPLDPTLHQASPSDSLLRREGLFDDLPEA